MRDPARSIEWAEYEIFDPCVDRPLHELPRAKAKAAYDRLMNARSGRVVQLAQLASANGVDVEAPDGLQRLNDWFRDSVEPSNQHPDRLDYRWYSIVNDIGLLLGERAILESGGRLHWEFYTVGRKDVSYQRHVIVGFAVPNPNYNVDFDLLIGMYGHRVVQGHDVDSEYFTRILHGALEKS